jgi:hypothetical protein
MDLTEGHAALRAARSLFRSLVAGIEGVDLLEIAPTLGGRPLLRHSLRRLDELQHPLAH